MPGSVTAPTLHTALPFNRDGVTTRVNTGDSHDFQAVTNSPDQGLKDDENPRQYSDGTVSRPEIFTKHDKPFGNPAGDFIGIDF